MSFFKRVFLFIVLYFFISCTSGTNPGVVEAGNPPTPTRTVSGTLIVEDCSEVSVEFFDTESTVITESFEDECVFSQELSTGKAWGIRFISDNSSVSMLFENGEDLPLSSVYYHGEGTNAIELGNITIAGYSAYPEFEPSTFVDADSDGVVDFLDDDDDNDGTPDTVEYTLDCDSDGFIDDFDLDQSTCTN